VDRSSQAVIAPLLQCICRSSPRCLFTRLPLIAVSVCRCVGAEFPTPKRLARSGAGSAPSTKASRGRGLGDTGVSTGRCIPASLCRCGVCHLVAVALHNAGDSTDDIEAETTLPAADIERLHSIFAAVSGGAPYIPPSRLAQVLCSVEAFAVAPEGAIVQASQQAVVAGHAAFSVADVLAVARRLHRNLQLQSGGECDVSRCACSDCSVVWRVAGVACGWGMGSVRKGEGGGVALSSSVSLSCSRGAAFAVRQAGRLLRRRTPPASRCPHPCAYLWM
jgi:hypothetical protein